MSEAPRQSDSDLCDLGCGIVHSMPCEAAIGGMKCVRPFHHQGEHSLTRSSPPSPETPLPPELELARFKGVVPPEEIIMLHEGIMDKFNETFDRLAASPRSSLTAPTELTEALTDFEHTVMKMWAAPTEHMIEAKASTDAARSKVEEMFGKLREYNIQFMGEIAALRDENERLRHRDEKSELIIQAMNVVADKLEDNLSQLRSDNESGNQG